MCMVCVHCRGRKEKELYVYFRVSFIVLCMFFYSFFDIGRRLWSIIFFPVCVCLCKNRNADDRGKSERGEGDGESLVSWNEGGKDRKMSSINGSWSGVCRLHR